MLVLTSLSILIGLSVFGALCCCFRVFVLSVEGSVVQHGVAHELLLYHFHSSHDRGWISLFENIDSVCSKVYFLDTSLASCLLLALSLRFCWLSVTARSWNFVFIHYS